MARRDDKDDAIKRRRRREEEDQAEALERARKNKPEKTSMISTQGLGIPRPGSERTTLTSTGIGQSAELHSMIKQATAEIERVHQLYQKFLAGVDKVPPIQARANLDALVTTIEKSSKMTAATQFQTQTLMSRVRTYREKWDKLMKAREGE